MSTLPTISWLDNPQKVVADALGQYGLSAIRLRRMSSTSNAVFRVETGDGDFVLRLHRFGNQDIEAAGWTSNIASELQWLGAISRDTELDVPHPLANRDGGLVTLVDGGEDKPVLCSVLGWMDGRFYNRGLRPVHLAKIGVLTARLHSYSESGRFVPPAGFNRGRADAIDGPNKYSEFPPMQSDVGGVVDYLGRLCSELGADLGKMITTSAERVWSDLDELGMGNDRFGLIHADIHQWNYLFGQGKAKLIDFDNVGYAHYLYDFAVILNNILDRPDYGALRDAMLRGYQTVRPLPSEQRRYIRSLIALRNLQLIQWTLIWPAGSVERKERWYDVEESLTHLRGYTANEEW